MTMPEPATVSRDDEELIARSLEGDDQAKADLFLKYQASITRWAGHIVKRAEDAQDIAQDVFLKIFQGLPEYRGESKFSVWVYRITFNLSVNFLQRVQKRHVPLEEFHHASLESEPLSVHEERLERETRQEAALAALEHLPLHYRMVLNLYYFQDYSYEDISRTLNLPLNTVKTHLRRAKALLAEQAGGGAPPH